MVSWLNSHINSGSIHEGGSIGSVSFVRSSSYYKTIGLGNYLAPVAVIWVWVVGYDFKFNCGGFAYKSGFEAATG